MDKQNAVYPHNEILFDYEKEWISDIYYNVDDSWKHSTEWKKPDTQDPTLYDSICKKYLE